jgi:mono/diheme cytochrome c family protein
MRYPRVQGIVRVGGLLVAVTALVVLLTQTVQASWRFHGWRRHTHVPPVATFEGFEPAGPAMGGTWYWLRSPDQEKRIVASLYNRYCLRCHGVDGRGVWDIPDVPDFTSSRWQAHRSDAQLARAILEGRGAVMPAFRGTLTLEESWAMARYLRSFVPGTEMSRPLDGEPQQSGQMPPVPPATDR